MIPLWEPTKEKKTETEKLRPFNQVNESLEVSDGTESQQ